MFINIKNKITKLNLKVVLSSILFIIVTTSLIFAFVKERNERSKIDENSASKQNEQISSILPDHHYVVYYFHGNARCVSCHKIENYTLETVKQNFQSELESKKLIVDVINVEEKLNNHYIYDYSLTTKAVILSEVNNGKEVNWKNLDRVWELLGDQKVFSTYIEKEVKTFLNI